MAYNNIGLGDEIRGQNVSGEKTSNPNNESMRKSNYCHTYHPFCPENNADCFLYYPYPDDVVTICKKIIEYESPINEYLLLKRYCRCVDIRRLTESKRNGLLHVIRQQLNNTKNGNFITYWRYSDSWDKFNYYRLPENESEYNRDMTGIPYEEIVNAICDIIRQGGSIDADSAVVATSRLFGFNRTGQNISSIIEEAIGLAIRKNIIQVNGGRYYIK